MLFYSLEIRDGRIVNHSVTVSNKNRSLTVFNPEPMQIISGGQLIIKGQSFDSSAEVLVKIKEVESSAIIDEFQVNVEQSDGGTYLRQYSLPVAIEGEIELTISNEDHSVSIPLTISQYNRY